MGSGSPTEQHLVAAREVHDRFHDSAHRYHQRRGGLRGDEHWPNLCLNNCGDVSDELAAQFAAEGWVVEEGSYLGPGGRGQHAWNRLADGSVLDATADQYGHAPVMVVPPGDDRQAWYAPDPT